MIKQDVHILSLGFTTRMGEMLSKEVARLNAEGKRILSVSCNDSGHFFCTNMRTFKLNKD